MICGLCLTETEIILFGDAEPKRFKHLSNFRSGVFTPMAIRNCGTVRVKLLEKTVYDAAKSVSHNDGAAIVNAGAVRQRKIKNGVRFSDPIDFFKQREWIEIKML